MSDHENAAAAGGKLTLAAVERFLMAASMGVLCLLTMANVLVRYFTDISALPVIPTVDILLMDHDVDKAT